MKEEQDDADLPTILARNHKKGITTSHLDVITEDLAVPLCSSLTQSLSSLATSGHPLAVVESLKGADVKVSVFISPFDI